MNACLLCAAVADVERGRCTLSRALTISFAIGKISGAAILCDAHRDELALASAACEVSLERARLGN